MGVSIDVTDRRRGEEMLRISEARLEAGADLAGLAFYEVDFDRRTVYVDDRFRELCGLPPDHESGLRPLEFWIAQLHPDDRERILDAREQLHKGKMERLSVEYRFLNPGRGDVWIQHLGRVAERTPDGRAVRSYGVLRDITRRKTGRRALRKSYSRDRALEGSPPGGKRLPQGRDQGGPRTGRITGQSAAIQKVLHQAEQVAPTNSAVLILGETGTGKELLAQAIHRLSPRARNVIVKINCAALPSGLVESELFGSEKGAFTGALARQVGRFEVADGSTIFLDEIGELPPDVQAKLLRVLQEGEFERLGSPRTIKVDVRVIAATNRDLTDESKGALPRGPLLPPQRLPDPDAAAAGAAARTSRCSSGTSSQEFTSRMGKKITQVPARDDGDASALRVAGQRPRTAERHRARGDHHQGRDTQDTAARWTSASVGAARRPRRRRARAHSPGARANALAHQGAEGRRSRARTETFDALRPHEETRHPAARGIG